MYPWGIFWCNLCNGGQNLLPLVGIWIRYKKKWHDCSRTSCSFGNIPEVEIEGVVA
jgi:hypothetical protein